MKTVDETLTPASNDSLTQIDLTALDAVTGGCGACGQTCAAGPAPTARAGAELPGLLGAFGASAQR